MHNNLVLELFEQAFNLFDVVLKFVNEVILLPEYIIINEFEEE
jgi:hypothetical protein